MDQIRKTELVDALRSQIRARELGARPSGSLPSLPFGVSEIDAVLPTGGLSLGAVHEIFGGGPDLMHGVAAISFAGGVLARTIGPIVWAFPRHDLFPPALAGVGVHPDRVVYCEAGKDVLLVVEEALRHAGLGAVVGEVSGPLGLTASRRLPRKLPAFLACCSDGPSA